MSCSLLISDVCFTCLCLSIIHLSCLPPLKLPVPALLLLFASLTFCSSHIVCACVHTCTLKCQCVYSRDQELWEVERNVCVRVHMLVSVGG